MALLFTHWDNDPIYSIVAALEVLSFLLLFWCFFYFTCRHKRERLCIRHCYRDIRIPKKQFGGYPQVHVVRGEEDDPRLPKAGLDGAVILHAYHEMTKYDDMLRHILSAFKPGARLVIVDAISDSRIKSSRSVQTERHEVAASYVRGELQKAGFELLLVDERFVKHPYHDWMWMIVARKPTTTQ